MKCLNYKKGKSCNNRKCQFGYMNCANFQCDIWDFKECQNYDLEPSKAEIFDFIQRLNTLGVSYKNEDGSFKSVYELLEEVGKKYKDM